jgi:hypothetical protein
MTTKEQLIRKIETISEADAEALLKNLETATQPSSHDPANPAHFTRIYGSWKDSRTTEETINDLSESRERPSRSVSL